MAYKRVSDEQFAKSKHRYTDPRTKERVISVTSIVGNFMLGDPIGRAAAAAVKIEKAGGNYRQEWDDKRDIGRDIHEHIDAWANGRVTHVLDEHLPLVQGFAKWIGRTKPNWIEAERPVVGKGYGGRFDLIGEIDGEFWSLDAKTGRLYQESIELQLAGYNGADGMIVYDANGWAVDLEPIPFVTRWGALHIEPNETTLIEVCPSPEEKQAATAAFYNLLAVRQWADGRGKTK